MKQATTKLIVKFLGNELSQEESESLKKWMELPENKLFLKQEIELYHLINKCCVSFDAEKAYSEHVKSVKIKKTTKVINIRKPLFKYAAAILIVTLATSYLFKDTLFNSPQYNTPIVINNTIESGTDKATLTLEDGTKVLLEEGANFQTPNIISNGEEIVYTARETNTEEIDYNYLTIPRGGQFFVNLSDGTKVWLNSETKLKYPVSFVEGETRQVELIYGEAYFEVSHSTEHLGSHFKVYNKNEEVEVLGTKFNIKAYKDETDIYTTLVDGKVKVRAQKTELVLEPKQQVKVSKTSSELSIKEVNVNNIISWKDGNFDFKDVHLGDIMKVLSRWYIMDVTFENEELMKERFNGRISKHYGIEEILSSIKESGIINNYEINNKKLTIK